MLNFYRRDKILNAMLNLQIIPVDNATRAGPRAALSSVQENTAKESVPQVGIVQLAHGS